jgi:hypothetical protein
MDPEIQSILDKDSLESIFSNVKFLDTDNGSRNNTLIDPVKTVQVGLEDIKVPEEYEFKTVGAGPNQREILVKKDRPKGLNRFLAGFVGDALLGRDWDRQGGVRGDWAAESPITGYGAEWNEETKKKISEKEGKADLSGDALPSKEEFKKRLELNALQKQAQRIELAKDAELNNALAAKQIQTNTEALYPYLLRAQLDAQMSPYGQTIIRGRSGDLSASMKEATARQLYAATQAAQAGLGRPAGIRYANTTA